MAISPWPIRSCFHVEANDILDETERIGEDRLGETSLAVLDFIREYVRQVGIAPSMEEIAQNVHVASRSVAQHHLNRLAQAGKIKRLPIGRRGVLSVKSL